MEPYYQDAFVTLYNARCEDVLPTLRERAALVLTDPPYGVNERAGRKTNGRSHVAESIDWMPIAGDNEPFDPQPLLALQTKLILWGANHYADRLPPSPTWFTWDKRDGTTSDDNADCEYAWTNLGGPARLFRHLWRGMIKASEQDTPRRHPTQKPIALMRWCLERARLAPGSLVLDPYMGSGPVAQACREMGLRYIGIELVEQYCQAAVERVDTRFRPSITAPPADWRGTLFEGVEP